MLTTQLYFDEGVTEQVYEREPYNANSGRDTLNEADSIFDEALLLDLRPEGKGYLGADLVRHCRRLIAGAPQGLRESPRGDEGPDGLEQEETPVPLVEGNGGQDPRADRLSAR